MIEFLTEMLNATKSELTSDQCNLMNVAFRNSIENERKAIAALNDIQDFKHLGKFHRSLAVYKSKMEEVMQKKCQTIITIIEKRCIPVSQTSESKVFWLKLVGDFYRYMAEACHSKETVEVDDKTLSTNRNVAETITLKRLNQAKVVLKQKIATEGAKAYS